MKNKYRIAIIALLITCSLVMCSCTGPKSNTEALDANSLNITIGPISEFYYYNSKHSWEFELPVSISNNCGKPLYVANPDPAFDSWGDLTFFLVNRNDILIQERPSYVVLRFADDCWKKLAAGESMVFSKHVIVNQMEENDAPNDSGRLKNIEFFSNSPFGMYGKYKITAGEYKLFARFTYDNPRPQDEQRWLEWVHLPVNDAELSKFWHGKIESNHLNLELKEVKK
jgi:hypothetical protein